MLPPVMTNPTRRSLKRGGSASTAARPAAPAPSATVFSISRSRLTACSMAASGTTTTSSTNATMISRGRAPARATPMPSAMVGPPGTGPDRPWRASDIEGYSSLSTPISSMAGATSAATTAIPARRPPPPTGTSTASRSSTSANSSSATVPWPATTAASSNGTTRTRPSRTTSASASASAAARSSPWSTTMAPKASVLATFTLGVVRGITMTAGIPRRVA